MPAPMLHAVLSALGTTAAPQHTAGLQASRDNPAGNFARQLQQAQLAPPPVTVIVPRSAPAPTPAPTPAPSPPQAAAAASTASSKPAPAPTHASPSPTARSPSSSPPLPQKQTERSEQGSQSDTAGTASSDAGDAAPDAVNTDSHASTTPGDIRAARRIALARAAARERGESPDGSKRRAHGTEPRASEPDEADADTVRSKRLPRQVDTESSHVDGTVPALLAPLPAADQQRSTEAAEGLGQGTAASAPDDTARAVDGGSARDSSRSLPGATGKPEAADADVAGASAAAVAGTRARTARAAATEAAEDTAHPTALADPRGAAAASTGPDPGVRTAFVDALASAVSRVAGPAAADAPALSPAAVSAMPASPFDLSRNGLALATGSAGAPRELTVPTPVTAADFIPRLTGDLAVLARDGVQEARVNVHPAELGPIAVQITLDGTAAQVHLAVDSAQTRDVLEQAMPALAAALRDSGLTLTGGGVFQQARQQAREPTLEPGTPRGRGTDDPAEPVDAGTGMPVSRRLRALGALDVYA